MATTRMVSHGQLEMLVSFMEENSRADDRARTPSNKLTMSRLWSDIASRLNSMGEGSTKPASRWRMYWNDKKTSVSKKAAAIKGGSDRSLTDLEERILNINGKVSPISEESVKIPFDPLSDDDYSELPYIEPITEVHIDEEIKTTRPKLELQEKEEPNGVKLITKWQNGKIVVGDSATIERLAKAEVKKKICYTSSRPRYRFLTVGPLPNQSPMDRKARASDRFRSPRGIQVPVELIKAQSIKDPEEKYSKNRRLTTEQDTADMNRATAIAMKAMAETLNVMANTMKTTMDTVRVMAESHAASVERIAATLDTIDNTLKQLRKS